MTLAEANGVDPGRPAPVGADDFREALARLASGLAIVACYDRLGAPRGLLVSSISGLSVDPPRFLFCVRKEASAHEALLAAGPCSLALLSASQVEVARRFSQGGSGDRFAEGDWRFDEEAPRLRGGVANCLGHVERVFDAGSHSIFVLGVDRLTREDGDPLIYVDRRFVGSAPLETPAGR